MSLDSATDPLIANMAALIQAHVNGATAAALGESAIRTLYTHPDILALAPQGEHPSLSVFRGIERGAAHSIVHFDQRVQIVLDYVTPLTPLSELGARWPLLNLVWREALRAVRLGASSHASASYVANARVLDAAGMLFFYPATISKVDRFAETPDGGSAYPSFRATFEIDVREDIDTSALPNLTSLFSSLHLRDALEGTPPGTPVTDHVRSIAP